MISITVPGKMDPLSIQKPAHLHWSQYYAYYLELVIILIKHLIPLTKEATMTPNNSRSKWCELWKVLWNHAAIFVAKSLSGKCCLKQLAITVAHWGGMYDICLGLGEIFELKCKFITPHEQLWNFSSGPPFRSDSLTSMWIHYAKFFLQ